MGSCKTVTVAGINWAAEDFVLAEDATLMDGTVLKRGKRFFTWYEAINLEFLGKLPEGMRLPTLNEFVELYKKACYGEIFKLLGFKSQGMVFSSYGCMDTYNHSPENVPEGIISDLDGGYWVGAYDRPGLAFAFCISPFGDRYIEEVKREDGFCIRCVEGDASTVNREVGFFQKRLQNLRMSIIKKRRDRSDKYFCTASEREISAHLIHDDGICEDCPRLKNLN